MATEKQIAANRRNAQNSTGPRSVEGKAASSRNALKTGLYCRGIIVGKESSAQLEELEAAYSAEYAPATPAERALVDSLIHYEWLLRRYRWLETETWRATYAKLTAAQCEDHSWTGHAFIEQPAIARIHRLRNQTQRLYHETLGQLRALQADRSTAEPDPQPTEELTQAPKLASFRQIRSRPRWRRKMTPPRPPVRGSRPPCRSRTHSYTG